jgi:hypothetical protein
MNSIDAFAAPNPIFPMKNAFFRGAFCGKKKFESDDRKSKYSIFGYDMQEAYL